MNKLIFLVNLTINYPILKIKLKSRKAKINVPM